jgi:hypothetical protein
MLTAELDSIKGDEADAECLASACEAFVPVDGRWCIEFFEEETRGEGIGFEDRFLLQAKVVVLMVVPALTDDAMKMHDLVMNVGIGEAIGVKKDHAQGDVLVHAKVAAVVVVGSHSATGLGWRVDAMGAGAGRAGSWLMIARGLEGSSVIGPCPPIMRVVFVVPRAGAIGKVRWV